MNEILDLLVGAGIPQNVIQYIIVYKYWGIFVGSVFFAETVILSIFFMAGQGYLNPWAAFFMALLGTILSDLFWYFLGGGIYKMIKKKDFKKESSHLMKILDDQLEKNILASILCIKFAYGTRFFLITYIAFKKIPFLKFLKINLLASTIWLIVMFLIGWFAGRGSYNFISIYFQFQYFIFGVIFIFIIYLVVSRLAIKFIKSKYGKS